MQRISNAVATALAQKGPSDHTVVARYGYRVIRHESGYVSVCYRGTIVAQFDPDFATVTLTTRGWRTVTTKRVINAALDGTGYRLFQRDFDWYIVRLDGIYRASTEAGLFKEGMTLDLHH